MFLKKTTLCFLTIILCVTSISCLTPQKKNGTNSNANAGAEVAAVLNKISGEPVVPREANRIFIPPFSNSAREEGFPGKLLLRIKNKINMDGRLTVVNSKTNAHLLLRGGVTGYRVQGVEYDGFRKPVKKRLWVTVSVQLTNLKKGKVIFYERNIQSFKAYSDVVFPIISDSQAEESVLEDMAKRISLKVITGWYTEQMTNIEKGEQ
ncbi:MAG: hypothetical protein GY754_23510 [bacterium]|nr:hypothetical protein [bacterium]